MATYSKHGLTFMYPENWKLSEQSPDPIENGPREISLEAPSGCFWALHVFEPEMDPDFVLKEIVMGLEQQYEDFEFAPAANKSIGGQPTISGDANFYCLDFLVTARIEVIQTPDFVFSVLTQAESRDFDKMEEVFLAITTSLVLAELPTETGS